MDPRRPLAAIASSRCIGMQRRKPPTCSVAQQPQVSIIRCRVARSRLAARPGVRKSYRRYLRQRARTRRDRHGHAHRQWQRHYQPHPPSANGYDQRRRKEEQLRHSRSSDILWQTPTARLRPAYERHELLFQNENAEFNPGPAADSDPVRAISTATARPKFLWQIDGTSAPWLMNGTILSGANVGFNRGPRQPTRDRGG